MNRTTCMKHAKRLALGLAALAIAATPSFAQTIDLCATSGSVTMPDTTVVPIWGYVLGTTCTAGDATLPGPVLRTTQGAILTINLYNELPLPVNVSIVVPGYRAVTTGGATGMFTAEAAPGGMVTYEFTARAGTYLYHSGTNIRTQVPMGLYGALVVDVVEGSQAYSDVFYQQDEVLVYSEIDPNLNADPANFGGARVINWIPQYYMINGAAQPETADILIGENADVLLRFVNAGIQTYVPTLDGGLYLDLKAEDGNRYPQPFQQYGIELQAGKTIDAMVSAAEGSYAIYDRAASYDSGVTSIIAGEVVGAPTAVDDPSYSVAEDGSLTADGILPNPAGVLDNDSVDAIAAVLVSGPSTGTLVGGLASDGSFTYEPNANFNGIDIFTYKANNGAGGPNSNVATVTITVTPENDAPVAVADAYDAIEGVMLSVTAPGVLWNDSDVDGNSLTAVLDADVANGALTLLPDGSFTYTPTGLAGTSDSFDYHAFDGLLPSNVVTVSLAIVAPADNIAPFANDDFASTPKNSLGIDIDVTFNDVDADGFIDPTTVVLTTGGNTQRGGTVSVDSVTGVVTYVPKRGFRGTDTFKYEVNDDAVPAATSNVATVRVNVDK
jgi:FtsP/CotA-like multicopper oxidase with cupredoxin domain